jgi:hypothetical protein
LPAVPVVDVTPNLVFGIPVSFLKLSLQLIAPAVDDIEIVVCQLSPLLLYFTSRLLPIAFNTIPVHFRFLSRYVDMWANRQIAINVPFTRACASDTKNKKILRRSASQTSDRTAGGHAAFF